MAKVKKLDPGIKDEITKTLKEKGLDVGEEAAVMVVKAMFALMILLIPKVSAGLGVIVAPIVAIVEPQVLAMLDKIDGEDDEGR